MITTKDLIFYHGTNTVFIDYIVKYGLGGYDIVRDSKGIELLSKLDRLAENRAPKKYMDFASGMLRLSVTGILLQTPGDFMNWQHGDVYITPSLPRALRYAVENVFGSELFTFIYNIYNFLTEHEIYEARDMLSDYLIVKEIISKNGNPIVIEISNLSETDLLTEGGADSKRVLNKLQDLSRQHLELENDYLDNFGFRLNKTIPYDQLIIHPIKKS